MLFAVFPIIVSLTATYVASVAEIQLFCDCGCIIWCEIFWSSLQGVMDTTSLNFAAVDSFICSIPSAFIPFLRLPFDT